jgi:hypothetical protein
MVTDEQVRVGMGMKGAVRIFRADDPSVTLYERKNVIVNGVSSLFARLAVQNTEPFSGVWGLAIGAGGTGAQGWSSSAQPDPTVSQTAMVSEILRKPLSSVLFLDSNGNVTATPTTTVAFRTTVNATTDNVTVAAREMGLIGGGTSVVANGGPTNMLTAPYFDPNAPAYNSVVLINYATIPPFLFPPRTDLIVEWRLFLG